MMLVEKVEGQLIVSTADYQDSVDLPECEGVKWIAVDNDGDVFAYRNKPSLSVFGSFWIHNGDHLDLDDFEWLGTIGDAEDGEDVIRDVEDSIWELEL